MHRLGYRLAMLALVLGLSGCGGGIPEGIPPGATQGLTPEQEKQHKELMELEAGQGKTSKAARKGP